MTKEQMREWSRFFEELDASRAREIEIERQIIEEERLKIESLTNSLIIRYRDERPKRDN
jgi:hypothetical protein